MTIEIREVNQPTDNDEEIEDMASGVQGAIAVIISSFLFQFVYPQKLGYVFDGRTNFTMPKLAKGQERQPDVAFVACDRLPNLDDDRIPVPPYLAVEVISNTDSWSAVMKKAQLYLNNGVKLVWVVDPYSEAVLIFRPNRPFQTLNVPDDELDGENILPGFRLKLSTIFENV